MKLMTALSFMLMAMQSIAQERSYVVEGNIRNLPARANVYLAYKKDGANIYDSVKPVNGDYRITGKCSQPFLAWLAIDYDGVGLLNTDRRTTRNISKKIYIEEGTIRIDVTDSLKNAKVLNSPINDVYAVYTEKIEQYYFEKLGSLERSSSPDTTLIAFTRKQWKKDLKAFIESNSNSFIAIEALQAYGVTDRGAKTAPGSLELYNMLTDEAKNSIQGKAFRQRLMNDELLSIGSVAPDFAQSTPGGKMLTLKSLRGKYVLIDFWASWCGPCRDENPNLRTAFAKHKADNFTILGVSLDKPGEKDKWLQAIKDDQLTWSQVSDLKGWSNELVALYSISAVPQNFLLDPDGKIIAKNLYGGDLNSFLDKLFQKKL
ncbi:MAG: AhpC/TSA family protein [Chitinophagaceae bacterium]|nr:MAG: AhpC/TSA family protein [Chitinophagaceae bacterium]